MKSKYLLLASAFLVSGLTFAQKDELKTLKKIYDKDEIKAKDLTEYKAAIEKSEPLLANASESDKIYLGFYKSLVPFIEAQEAASRPENRANPQAALMKIFNANNIFQLADNTSKVIEFEKTSGKQVLTKSINEDIADMKPMLLNYAVNLGKQKNYKDATTVLYSLYLLDKTDLEKLYYAGNYAVNDKDYDKALTYYNELIKQNYSGERSEYMATSKLSGEEVTFASLADREKAVKMGTHEKPRTEQIKSKRGEIYRNVALIYNSKGDVAAATKAVAEARAANPDDLTLAMTQADLFMKSNNIEGYKQVIAQVISKSPNDPNLFYNLGVLAAQANENVEAEKYYKKAIEIDPNYINAYLNLSVLKLNGDTAIVDEMNKLGTSAKDNKRYDELKVKREAIFKSTLPYLEKANKLDPKNEDVYRTLLNVYNYLEMTSEAKALKASFNG
ncbi:tetratricopeptide repeat protein [Flavobacterium lindanitolerans]|uniref:Tetratricopeptide repeat protein n=1 Tax=Flavobacterium lindanitolerans TaxID=428988 RepID=A0A497U6I0_9FLAO|nr:tetratricopeptide repeat protein [Flavobacterium lindanitolerans]MBC8644657.1 tetratricopeptide repeat protein [Flavobacterium lindanitolerans]PKW20505.1 tetratricopeptide repeat protein [Flavobacterium lindanitolerans]RLJ23948.1 tetratricopeptide repeat protein [Flavobacterium lindanitolerans]